jgi:hypothetical protein
MEFMLAWKKIKAPGHQREVAGGTFVYSIYIGISTNKNKRPKGLNGHLSTIIKDPLFDY